MCTTTVHAVTIAVLETRYICQSVRLSHQLHLYIAENG